MRRTLVLTALLIALGATASGAFAKDRSLLTVDGYLRAERHGGSRTLVITEHTGIRYVVVGNTAGLASGDHVLLLGRRVPGDRYGRGRYARDAFSLIEVQAIWADDRHKTVYFDHLQDGSYDRYTERHRQHRYREEGGRPGRDPWRDDSASYGDWGEWRRPGHVWRPGERPPY